MKPVLSPANALIFRITHIKNVAWILDHGLHAQSSDIADPDFVGIGLKDLIERRKSRAVGIAPYGYLSDYIPFYFTPYSIMMYNIRTGCNAVIQRPREDIAVLVASLHRLQDCGVSFVFTNGHAYAMESQFFNGMDDLGHIDWKILQDRDFRRNPDDPGKLNRYQAEALAYRHVPANALLGIVCYNDAKSGEIAAMAADKGLGLQVKVRPGWYL